MAESYAHSQLVKQLISFVASEFGELSDIVIRDDSASPTRGERPPYIGGFVPDVFATDVPTTSTLIGEAKTRIDLETTHSVEQITAFLRYLSATKNGIFVLSVPLSAAATARRIVTNINESLRLPDANIIVLDGLPRPDVGNLSC